MLYELKQGVVLYDLKYEFEDDLTGATVGYTRDKGTDDEGTLYNVVNYDLDSIDVTIVDTKDRDRRFENVFLEAKEQFDRNVLFSDEYYNEFIGCKIHAKHVRGIQNV